MPKKKKPARFPVELLVVRDDESGFFAYEGLEEIDEDVRIVALYARVGEMRMAVTRSLEVL